MTQIAPREATAAPTLAQGLAAALQAGDLPDAERALARLRELGLEASLPAPLLRVAAEMDMRQQRWQAAADALARLADPPMETQLARRFSANLACLQRRRPEVYRLLSQAPQSQRYGPIVTASGQLTIVDRSANPPLIMSTGSDPRQGLQKACAALQERAGEDKAVALAGIGDGYLLQALAQHPPPLFLDQEQAVHLLEPDLELVQACLMIHDYTGPQGPIEQRRFAWFVGAQWYQRFTQALCDDPFLPKPELLAQQGVTRPAMASQLEAIGNVYTQHLQRLLDAAAAHYQPMSGGDFAALLRDNPPRRPRVLVATSRFTQVLQYSARQVVEALGALGVETQFLIEPHRHSRLSNLAVAAAVERFKPDLFFCLDHLRSSVGQALPAHVPFVCWIQDLLPALTNRQAGASIGQRDYVLTFCAPMLVEDCGYPARQCIDVPMMMAGERPQPAAPTSNSGSNSGGGADLLYMSHMSRPAAEVVPDVLAQAPEISHELMRRCCQRMIALYEAGGSLPTKRHVRALLEQTAQEQGVRVTSLEARKALVDALSNPLNITLYRQQALAWVEAAALDLGLELALYGRGWEKHPRFGAYARGVIAPGPEMDALVRASRINLMIEPYPCVTHSRLIDGLLAGGFFLIRAHPVNTLLPRLAAVLSEHGAGTAADAREALRAVPSERRDELEALLRQGQCVCWGERDDAVQQVRAYERAGVLPAGQPLLPHLPEVSFDDAASCRAAVARFAGDAEARSAVASQQRRMVQERLTATVGMRRVLAQIAQLLASE